MKTRLELAALLAALLLFLPVGAQSPTAGLPGVPAAAREAMLRGETQKALEALDKALLEQPAISDALTYLRAAELARADRRPEALAALDRLETQFPKSKWAHKARFLRADLLRDERRFEEASSIYEAQAVRLFSPERQAELAQIYLRFAEELAAAPVAPGGKPDFARAAKLFARALELSAPDALRERAAYRRAQCIEATENWSATLEAYGSYLEAFDPTVEREAATGSPTWIFAARLARARAQLRVGDAAGSRRTLEDLSAELRRAAAGEGKLGGALRALGGEKLREVLGLDGEAQYSLASTWFAEPSNRGLGIASLERFVERFPTHARTPRARLELGEARVAANRTDEALAAFDAILALPRPAGGDALKEATGIAARALYVKGLTLASADRHEEARAAFVAYTLDHPSGVDWGEAQQRIPQSEYNVGATLREREEFEAAKKSWSEYLARHPLDPNAPQILFEIGELDAALAQAESTPAGERPPRWRAAVATWRELEAKYAESNPDWTGRARLRMAQVLEAELGDFAAAIAAYKACGGTPSAGEALAALDAMTEPSLSISVEGAVLASEAVRATLHVRNLEKVTVELWRLDLEAYYRKNLTHENVESLDLDLISAQKKFELTVKDYAVHKAIEQQFDLEVEGPGAWVIAVSSGKLRSSALCLRSDLDLIVKSTTDEALVFAQDMARGEPAAGVRVLAALGERRGTAAPVVLEGLTDQRGFVRFSLEPRPSAGRISVLGLREGHWSSSGVGFQIFEPPALLPRAVLYTDRTAYRAGELVHWRAIVRGAQDGSFAVQPGRKVEVAINDARGRNVSTQSLAQSEFGTVSGEFQLPALSALGEWTMRLSLDDAVVVNTAFTVAQFQLVHVTLAVDFERAVYYRGEEAVAIVDAHYSHGGPLSDSPLSFLLPDGRQGEGRTDAEGRARLYFPTRELAQEQVLELSVTLNDEALTTSARAWLAFREYSLEVETARDTYAIESPFTARIQARGPDGVGVARKLKLTTLKITQRPGRARAETTISEIEVTTDAEGAAAPLVKIAKGGDYVLRVSASDRFGNPIEAQSEIEIVGDEDPTTLRMLADSDVLKVGATGSAVVLEREKGGLALIAFEAGRVVEWRWTRLVPGVNKLEFPVPDALAPGFVLSIAHQRRGKFRQAGLEFQVERELEVTIHPPAAAVVPGSETAVEIEVRDSLGRPVAAELSLAIVDEALFELYPEKPVDLQALFQPPARAHRAAVDTDSSCRFRYEGSSWEVSGEVLAEARRVLEDRKWQEQRAGAAKELAGFAALLEPVDSPASPAPAGMEGDVATGGSYGARRSGRGGGGAGPSRGPGGSSKDKSSMPDPLSLRSPTAYWSAALTTDSNGKASVKFSAPDSSARWRVSARAAAKDPRAAAATAFFTTRAAFFVELRAPAALMEGDKPRFFARVHNTSGAPLTAELKLRLSGAGVETSLPASPLEVPPGVREVVFPELDAGFRPGELSLALEARASVAGKPVESRDLHSILVAPWGTEFADTESGELSSGAMLELELPRDKKYTNLSLELFVGASLGDALIDEALGLRRAVFYHGLSDDTGAIAADLLGAAEVLAQLARSARDSSTEFRRVRERVQSLTAALLSAQDPQQGWLSQWRGPDLASDLSAWAMLALAAARDAGITVAQDSSQAGLATLDRMLRATASEERKALLQHALARWGRGDYGALNRLHRLRNELSSAALAHATLALVAIDRLPMAIEIASVLEARSVFDPSRPELGGCWSVDKNLPWSRSMLGTAALCVLALEATAPKSTQLSNGVQYLLAHRPWSVPRSAGVALAALARHAGLTVPANERLEVTARVAGGAPKVLDLAQGGSWTVALDDASGAKVRVDLALAGRGSPHYVAILRGFCAAAPTERGARPFELRERAVLAPPPLWRGKPMPVGFSQVRNVREHWSNKVLNLARGTRALSSVEFRRDASRSGEPDGDWLVLEIPLPAGTRVKPGSIAGPISNSEILSDRIVAYLAPDTGWSNVQFELEGAIPGHYRVGPAVLRSASDPSLFSLGKPSEFDVLASGSPIPDAYRATPDELYALGMAAWKDGESLRAREWLTLLMKDFESVLADDDSNSPLQQAAGALFFLALEKNDAREVVRWFEVLREKRPDLVIPFDKILAVAKSYSTIDEHERALSILRASVEQTFGLDLKVAGAIEQEGDTSQALHLLARLWSEYPDAPAVLETWLALSDKLLTLAPKAAEDKSLVRDGRTRASLHMEGTRLLQMFLCLYPRDPQAPEAALNLIAAHFGLEDYQTASSLAQSFAARFTTPEFTDAFLHSRAVAEWYLGNDEEALRVCERVATSMYKDAKGIERPSRNRELAQYILAQIHHARREVERAAEYYAKVEQSFADARASLVELRARKLGMDEVTRAKPGETVRLSLRSKNVSEVDLAIYPVDLMTLYLREGDLSQVTQVDLSGIAPELARTMKLDGANSLREAEQKLELSLLKSGAYLVIARGGELFASGLILITELELDVTEDAEQGGVRVQIVDGRDGKYVRDVDVRVVGSADKRIQRAKTDLRGMVSLDQVNGLATIIARAGDERYAFYRGTRLLGAHAEGERRLPAQKAVEQLSQQEYLSNVSELNSSSQSVRAGRLIEEIGRKRLGVQIDQVK